MAKASNLIDFAERVERGRHDKEGRQRALIEAATQVFAEHGYDAATTREVAERAGCSEGLIHRYFKGKHGLLMAIMEDRAGEASRDFANTLPESADLAADLEAMLLQQLETMWQTRDFMRVSVSQATIDEELGQLVGDGLIAERRRIVEQKLRRHQAEGRIKAGIDLEAVSHAITGLGFSLGFMGQVVFAENRRHMADVSKKVAAVMAAGLAAEDR
jgi:AcrR family transcriptional regulator